MKLACTELASHAFCIHNRRASIMVKNVVEAFERDLLRSFLGAAKLTSQSYLRILLVHLPRLSVHDAVIRTSLNKTLLT